LDANANHISDTILQQREGDTLTIEVAAPRIRFLLLAGPIWLVGWCFGLYGAVFALGLGHRGYLLLDLFLIAWLILWILGGLAVAALVLWGYRGRERLTLTPDTVTLERLVFGYGRKQTFPRTAVHNFRFRSVKTDVFGAKSKWSTLGVGGGKVRFDCNGKGYSFGLGLPDQYAEQLAATLRQEVG
jgi:hypothetical protein